MTAYLLCRCYPRPEGGGNYTDPAVEEMFRAGHYQQVWNDHDSLTSLLVSRFEEDKPHECCTPLKDRDAALDWLTSVKAGAPVEYRDIKTGFDKLTADVPVEDILSTHERSL